MYEKEKDLIGAWRRGQMSRRSLIRGLGALGISAATASVLVNAMRPPDALAAMILIGRNMRARA